MLLAAAWSHRTGERQKRQRKRRACGSLTAEALVTGVLAYPLRFLATLTNELGRVITR